MINIYIIDTHIYYWYTYIKLIHIYIIDTHIYYWYTYVCIHNLPLSLTWPSLFSFFFITDFRAVAHPNAPVTSEYQRAAIVLGKKVFTVIKLIYIHYQMKGDWRSSANFLGRNYFTVTFKAYESQPVLLEVFEFWILIRIRIWIWIWIWIADFHNMSALLFHLLICV